jgi:hypothetical protein
MYISISLHISQIQNAVVGETGAIIASTQLFLVSKDLSNHILIKFLTFAAL